MRASSTCVIFPFAPVAVFDVPTLVLTVVRRVVAEHERCAVRPEVFIEHGSDMLSVVAIDVLGAGPVRHALYNAALSICGENRMQVDTVSFAPGNLARVVGGELIGSRISSARAKGRPQKSKKRPVRIDPLKTRQ